MNCSQCGAEIKRPLTDESMERAIGKKLVFCSENCLQEFKEENFCSECGGVVEEQIVCDECDKIFCSDECLFNHKGAMHAP